MGAAAWRLAVVLIFELVARVLRACVLCIPSFQFRYYNHSMLVSFLLLGIMIVLSILWEAFEVMLLPLPVKRRFRLVRLFFHWTWKSWSVVASTVARQVHRRLRSILTRPTNLLLGRRVNSRIRTYTSVVFSRSHAILIAPRFVLQR